MYRSKSMVSGLLANRSRMLLGLVTLLALAFPAPGVSQSGIVPGAGDGGGTTPSICFDCEPPDTPDLALLDAEFSSQSVPTEMFAGHTYPVSVRMINTGSKTWTAADGVKLGSQNPADNTTWTGRALLSTAVVSGYAATFTINVTAPATPGTYNFQWRMLQEGVVWFGAPSPNVPIVVTRYNQAPTVQLTSPVANGIASAPATITLVAAAVDPDGTVASVQFWSNGLLLGTDTSAPFSMTLSNVLSGSYEYKAVVTDERGASATSPTVNFSVNFNQATGKSLTRSYVYDAQQRLCKIINPESGATVFGYDVAGNIVWTAEGVSLLGLSCDRHLVSEAFKVYRDYDALNRVWRVRTPDGSADVATKYFADSQIEWLEVKNPGNQKVRTTYSYNKRRLVTGETSSNASTLFSLGYRYDGNGSLAALTYPDGQVVDYAPDALGRATRVATPGGQTYAADILYFANGAIRQFRFGNEIVHSMQPNLRGLPARSSDRFTGASPVAALDDTYSFDPNGNVVSITDAAQAGLTSRSMSYDGLDRLISANSPGQWGNASYGYDALDNLRVANQGPRQFRYQYNSQNRLTSILNPLGHLLFSLKYDVRGNTTAKNGQAYVFDYANRMNGVTGLQTYRYDGLGRRVQTTDADGKTTFWMYSRSGQVLYTSEARRSQNLAYIYLGNSQIATRAVAWGSGAVAVRYQHTDSLGSPVAETDPLRNIIKRNSYAPYGEAYGATAIDGTGYTGHVMDRGTGLTYMQQRYYDPQIGRFLSIDPISTEHRSAANFQRFSYANGSPYTFKDPDGRNGVAAFGGVLQESWNFANGNGFDGGRIAAAFSDGYDGEGSGRMAAAFDDVSTAVPGGAFIRVGKASLSAAKMINVRSLGRAGEVAANIVKNTLRIPSDSMTAAYRVPDAMTPTSITEVKNYSGKLRLTAQIKDFMSYAERTNRTFILKVAEGTRFSKKLQSAIDSGKITVERIEK